MVCVAGCGNDSANAGRVDLYTPLSGPTLQTLPLTDMGPDTGAVRVTVYSEEYRVGNPAKSDLEYFGDWLDAALLPNGSAVLWDPRLRRLTLVNARGKSALLGRVGSGPGEIRHASALLPNMKGLFGILDDALYRLTLYDLASGTAKFVRSYPTQQQPRRACSIDTSYIGLGIDPTDNTMFRVFPLGGTPHSGFALPPDTGSYFRNTQLALGPLLCLSEQKRIMVALRTGELVAYGLDGKFVWRKSIPDFEPEMFEQRPNGVIRTGLIPADANRSRLVTSLVRLNDSIGVIQLGEYQRSTEGDSAIRFVGMRSKLFDLRSGLIVGSQNDLPHILSATRDFLLLFDREPEPWVHLVRFSVSTKH